MDLRVLFIFLLYPTHIVGRFFPKVSLGVTPPRQRFSFSRTLLYHCEAFSQGVSADLQSALNEIQQQGMTGIVLDLRNDPGGLLDEAVGVASEFVKSGNVLLEKNAQGQIKLVPVKTKGLVTNLPVVVLIFFGNLIEYSLRLNPDWYQRRFWTASQDHCASR